jgi:hypothetical protein
MPRKTFLNGFPLPASDLNNYLMDQSVMTFASSAARTSAIASPVEGMITYLEDTNTYETWNGSAWVDILASAIPKSTVTTAGDLILGTGASAVTRLPIGATGRILSSNGTTASWELPPAASPAFTWTLLNSGGTALTGAAVITISGLSGYNNLFVRVDGASSASASSGIGIRLNGATTNYDWQTAEFGAPASYSTSIINSNSSSGDSFIRMANMSSNAASVVSGVVNVSGASTAGVKVVNFAGGARASGGNTQNNFVGGATWTNSAAVTNLSLFSSAGNFDAGTIFVYGA